MSINWELYIATSLSTNLTFERWKNLEILKQSITKIYDDGRIDYQYFQATIRQAGSHPKSVKIRKEQIFIDATTVIDMRISGAKANAWQYSSEQIKMATIEWLENYTDDLALLWNYERLYIIREGDLLIFNSSYWDVNFLQTLSLQYECEDLD
jgi:hypothetical protein